MKGMTDWIFRWNKNRYKTSKGFPVMNAGLFRSIEEEIFQLNALGVQVLFWHVPRIRNQEVHALANAAFDNL